MASVSRAVDTRCRALRGCDQRAAREHGGGVAPDTGCDASNAGKEAQVKFAADYYFYRRRG
jgi:hypothetical protein